MNDLDLYPSHRTGTALAPTGRDPFADYGASAQDGQFLSFKNGEWLFGVDGEMLELGTRLVASMEGLRRGWRCWKGKKLVADRTHLLSEEWPIEHRVDLGDNDPAMWERDKDGKPIDPWVLTDILEMADPVSGEIYQYATSSKGGTGCIKRLCKAYSDHKRQLPGMLPIVELGRDSYIHPEYKKVYVPLLPAVDWADANATILTEAAVDEADLIARSGDGNGDDYPPFEGSATDAHAVSSGRTAPRSVAPASAQTRSGSSPRF